MAETITTAEIGQTQAITLSGTTGVATEFTISENVRRVEVTYKTAGGGDGSGEYSHTGTDAVAIGADAFTVDPGVTREILLSGRGRALGGTVLYFAADTASAVLHIIAKAH